MQTAFYLSVLLVFLAEMGDKTQFAVVAFAARYSRRVVLTALTLATLASHLLSVWIGKAVHLVLPAGVITVAAGVAFIAFGVWTLRPDVDEDDSGAGPRRLPPFAALLVTFFATEIGDKTMLATVTLAAQYPRHTIAVWLGSTLGMLAADGLAIVIGLKLIERLPERFLKPATAVIFIVTGVATISGAMLSRTPLK